MQSPDIHVHISYTCRALTSPLSCGMTGAAGGEGHALALLPRRHPAALRQVGAAAVADRRCQHTSRYALSLPAVGAVGGVLLMLVVVVVVVVLVLQAQPDVLRGLRHGTRR